MSGSPNTDAIFAYKSYTKRERERERTYQVTYDAYLSKNANVNVKF